MDRQHSVNDPTSELHNQARQYTENIDLVYNVMEASYRQPDSKESEGPWNGGAFRHRIPGLAAP